MKILKKGNFEKWKSRKMKIRKNVNWGKKGIGNLDIMKNYICRKWKLEKI